MSKPCAIAQAPFVFTLLAVLGAACSPGTEAKAPAAAPAAGPSLAGEEPEATPARVPVDNSTAGVAQRHFKLLQEGSLEGLLEDYDEGAVIFTPEGAVKGREALSEHFTALLEEFGPAGAPLQLGDLRVRDETAYVTWSAETAKNKYEVASDTFVVKSGKIVAHTFAGRIVPKSGATEVSADAAADEIPETPTSTVLRHHLDAVEKAQMDELLTDYTIDSLILTQKGKKSGTSGVKEVFAGLFEEFANPKLKFEVKKMLVDGEMAYVVWSGKSADDPYGIVTETLVVRDGKVVSQTLTVGVKP